MRYSTYPALIKTTEIRYENINAHFKKCIVNNRPYLYFYGTPNFIHIMYFQWTLVYKNLY